MGLVRLSQLKRLFLGSPLPTAQSRHERLGRATALAVFASDALSSVADATEEILLVLVLAGTVALSYSIPISIAIAILIAIVVSSYRQTIRAYPQGGGAYIVSKDNLGVPAGLVAGAALLIDYVLTVAVSVAAGIAALTSAVPALFPYRPWLCVAAVVAIAVTNLRGIRESGKIFAAPTYLFIGSVGVLIIYGGFGALFDFLPEGPYQRHPPGPEGGGLFFFLRAFASGCTALAGVEAVSDGVPAFKPPEAHNARVVLTVLGVILIVLFLGITFLAYDFGIVPRHEETVVSQLARHVFGGGAFYYEIQAVTMLILLLAANTSFADFPRLSFFLARDRFIPRQFATQGDRLVFSNGIVILGGLAGLLLVIFRGDTHALIPLYAVGVFLSFTLSQASMVRRWLRRKEEGWWWRWWLNAVGALVTGLVMLTIAATKFTHGGWIVGLVSPHPDAIPHLLAGASPLRGSRRAALARRPRPAGADDQHGPGAGRRPPSGRGQGDPVRADALAECKGRVRGDGPGTDAAARGEVGQVLDGRAAHRAELALPVAARTADRVHRPHAGAGREPRGHDRAAGVHSGPLVAARAPQP